MAKKKRKRHRRPLAPPVHSAPESLHGPAGVPATDPPPSRPFAPEPPPTHTEPATHVQLPSAVRAREAARRSSTTKRKRKQQRTWLWVAAAAIVVIGAIVARQVMSNKASSQFDQMAQAAGCTKVKVTGSSGAGQHLTPGQRTKYDTSPPSHGSHDPITLPAGVYDKPLSQDPTQQATIYKAMHSLEHGAVIVWYDHLTPDEKRTLERTYRDETKVIVAPYPQLEKRYKIALTAWGRLMDCQKPNTKAIDAFIQRYRGARSAPEPFNQI